MEKIVVLISPLELLFTPFVIFYTHHDDVYCLPLQRKRVIKFRIEKSRVFLLFKMIAAVK